jgi:hypothetical protein|tara:strand:+ start:1429 stop:1776 length:348 start_codon:yes stop_codon:yes gene_type:complete
MRVEVTTIEDFCKELRTEAEKDNVWDKQVRCRIDRTPEQEEETSFSIGIWLTAIIDYEQDRFILELGIPTGSDQLYSEEPGQINGTARAEGYKERVQEICDDFSLTLRPGKFELY